MEKLKPMRILNYELAGRLVVEWAQGKKAPPEDMADMRSQLAGIVEIPERYQTLEVVQGDNHHFVLRLPPKDQVTQSEEEVMQETKQAKETGNPKFYYPPKFYSDLLVEKDIENDAFFYSRISDYTIRGCR